MQKVLVTGILGLLLVGCAADSGWKVAYEQERTTRQEQDSRIRNLEAQQRQQPQQTPAQQTPQPQPQQQPTPRPQQPQPQQKPMMTIEQILTACQNLKDNPSKYGVGCDLLDTERQEPTLAFGFKDAATFDRYWNTIVDELASAYCVHANREGIDGYVSSAVFDIRKGNIYSCRQRVYTRRWFDLPQRQPTVTNRY